MDAADILQSLGLTPIEALAYTYLVANPSATGYRVARGIGKPTANVYRALEGLERKGAVLRDRSAAPLFRALAPDELLGRLEREFAERRSAAARELAALHAEPADESLYPLGGTDQVWSRARALLASAARIVLADASGDIVDALAADLAAARARGVRVVVIARGATAEDGVVTWTDARPRSVVRPPLRIVADAREALLAQFSPDATRVHDAVWTRSAVFAAAIHDAITTELFFLEVARGVDEGLSVNEVEQSFERCRRIRGDTGD
jgi:sugar-specific transcriptional regulator TrmB